MFSTVTRLLAFLVLALMPGQGSAWADTWQSSDWHCSVKLPPGWQVASAAEVDAIHANLKKHLGNKPDTAPYLAGFYPQGGSLTTYPYALVSVISFEGSSASYDDIERILDSPHQAKKSKGSLDRTQNRVVMQLQMDQMGIGTALDLATGHISKDGVVFIHCYARESDSKKMLPSFTELNDGLQFDPGYNFVPHLSIWDGVAGDALLGAIVGTFIGLLGWALHKKKQTAT
jgi:hypothetical protein